MKRLFINVTYYDFSLFFLINFFPLIRIPTLDLYVPQIEKIIINMYYLLTFNT